MIVEVHGHVIRAHYAEFVAVEIEDEGEDSSCSY